MLAFRPAGRSDVSEHRVSVRWIRETADFAVAGYNRDHVWRFEGGQEVPASAAPAYLGSADRVDPEEAYVAALSSCHMLTFLAVAARKRLVVDRYEDDAVGHLEKNDDGKLAITRVTLRPRVAFAGHAPDAAGLAKIHERAHAECFIANSVRTEVTLA
jgi:organic hydroperoxide reductase OsmC/OhrA